MPSSDDEFIIADKFPRPILSTIRNIGENVRKIEAHHVQGRWQ